MQKLIQILLFQLIIFIVASGTSWCQMVKIEPAGATANDEVTIIFDANAGNKELANASKIYIHSGVVTSGPDGTDWNHVIGNWGKDDGVGAMTPVEGAPGKWKITLSPNVREYYNVGANETVFRLSMVFRNATGDKKATIASGSYDWGFVASNGDIYVNLDAGPYVSILIPVEDEIFVESGVSVLIQAQASDVVTSMKLSIKNADVFEEQAQISSGTEISYNYTPVQSGTIQVKVEATIEGVLVETTNQYTIIIKPQVNVEPLPIGLLKGINYDNEDNSKVTLVLEAPGKDFVYVGGDFTNWEFKDEYLMNKTPDGELFWLEVAGLEPQKEYVFQYWVDGNIKIGDPYAEKVADPWNDKHISNTTYPGLINYTKTSHGIASVLQTGQTPYEWDPFEKEWIKPEKETLVIYEILLRDFLETHSYKDLADTLTYLKKLGVNAIELMPVMEFEGNDSWGYNPSYFFAPDKYYGTPEDLKFLIETAHKEGIAVILDMVLNHAFGQNPMVMMYWDPELNTVSESSPWFNPVPKHPFNVGFDFNHESAYTQQFVDSVNYYWLNEYHFDGFRFDLSKGFTQQDNVNSVSAWSAYDASRISLLKRMADKIWSHSPDAYIILEHLADNKEEKELAEYRMDEGKGMLMWGNLNHAYNQNTMGYESESNIAGVYHETRNWEAPHLIGYMESHDEERLMFKNLEFGNVTGSYSVKNPNNALERMKAAGVLFYTIPGPKLIWQFGELGYPYSINRCPDGTISDNCRLAPKPAGWDLLNEPARKSLFNHTADLLRLREEFDVFKYGKATFSGNNTLIKQVTLESQPYSDNPSSAEEMNVKMVSNFDVTPQTFTVTFPHAGTWYDYYNGGAPIEISETSHVITLPPGGYKLFTDYPIEAPVVTSIKPQILSYIKVYPNPAEHVFQVEAEGKHLKNVNLINMMGQKIKIPRISNNEWDISLLNRGLYILNFEIDGKNHTIKLQKN